MMAPGKKTATILDAAVALDTYLATLLSEVPEGDLDEDIAEEVEHKSEVVRPEKVAGVVRPDWADRPFSCLVFRVGQITLMTPLTDLASTQKFPESEQLAKLPGLPRWTMGITQIHDQKIAVIDTVRLIAKTASGAASPENRGNDYSNILILKNHKWGFGCDEIIETREVSPEEIRWRKQAGQPCDSRPWLWGMFASELIGLMTLDTLVPIKK